MRARDRVQRHAERAGGNSPAHTRAPWQGSQELSARAARAAASGAAQATGDARAFSARRRRDAGPHAPRRIICPHVDASPGAAAGRGTERPHDQRARARARGLARPSRSPTGTWRRLPSRVRAGRAGGILPRLAHGCCAGRTGPGRGQKHFLPAKVRVMFIERHAEGNYKTKHAETRLGSTILPCTYTYTLTHIQTQTL